MINSIIKNTYYARKHTLSGQLFKNKQLFYSKHPVEGEKTPNLNMGSIKGFREYLEKTKDFPRNHSSEMYKPVFGYGLANYLQNIEENRLKIECFSPNSLVIGQSIKEFIKFQSKDIRKTFYFKGNSHFFSSKPEFSLSYSKKEPASFDNLFLINILTDCPNDRYKLTSRRKIQSKINKHLIYSQNSVSDSLLEVKNMVTQLVEDKDIQIAGPDGEFIECDEDSIETLSYYFFPDKLVNQSVNQIYLKESSKIRERGVVRSFADSLLTYLDRNTNEKDNYVWLSPVAVPLVRHLKDTEYRHILLFDYSEFGEVLKCGYSGENMPTVYSQTKDKEFLEKSNSILDKEYEVNSFSSTNFNFLEKTFKIGFNLDVKVETMNGFFEKNTKKDWFETSNGYNPLIDSDNSSSFLTLSK